VHRFGHWGPGWFELILIQPGTKQAEEAERLESCLADYPVLDEQDLSAREWEDYVESWNNCGLSRHFVRALGKCLGLAYDTTNALEDLNHDTLREFYQELTPSGDYYETCDNGANFGQRPMYAAQRCTRDRMAAFIRQHCRKTEVQP
jgi:hypothetical protein